MNEEAKTRQDVRRTKHALGLGDRRLEKIERAILSPERVAFLEMIAQKRGVSFAAIARESLRLYLAWLENPAVREAVERDR